MQESNPALSPHSPAPFSNQAYRQLFDHGPTPRAVFDRQGAFLQVNAAFCHLLGYERLNLLGEASGMAILFSDRQTAAELLVELEQRRAVRRREISLLDSERRPVPVLLSADWLELEGRSLIDLSLQEISKQRMLSARLEQEQARMRALLDSISAGLFLVDQDGRILEINLPLANLTGLDQQQAVGEKYTQIFRALLEKSSDPVIAQQDLARVLERIPERPIVEITTRGDPPGFIELAFFPVWQESGAVFGWGGLVQDITEVRERMAWKMELLSMLAHDIRTPLATLKGHATALAANYRLWDASLIEEFLEAISSNTDLLTRQVDRSLALTRVESGRLGLRPAAIDPRPVAKQAVERSAGVLGERSVILQIPDSLPRMRADPARIEETLTILIDNAARHAPSPNPILIAVVREKNMLRFSVQDDGPGIPAQRQRSIFEKYERQDPQSEGAGLGLYIARKIVEAHGGRIWVSAPDHGEPGSVFHFTLPVMPEQTHPEDPLPGASEQPSRQGELVLAVDDHPEMQSLLQTILSHAGFQVLIASSGQEALDLFKSTTPSLVLLDWMLPGMNGLAICRTIRRWSNVPLIMLTSRSAGADMIEALNAGADDYLIKPFQPSELLARINAALRRSGEWSTESRGERQIHGPLVLDQALQTAWLHGSELELTPTEYRLLAFLTANHQRVLTYRQIIDHLWGESGKTRKDLFVHISRLRSKIELDPKNPRLILTRWGVGYRFSPQ